MPTSATADSILQAARKAMAERGPGTLTMSAVAAAAGISRPTLYRWFPTKTDLLAAVSAYEETQFDIGLQVVIDSQTSPQRQLGAALRYLVKYLDESMMPDPIGIDPAFAIESMAQSIQPHVEILVRLLGDALLEVPVVREGTLSAEQAAELFLRLTYSHYLIPTPILKLSSPRYSISRAYAPIGPGFSELVHHRPQRRCSVTLSLPSSAGRGRSSLKRYRGRVGTARVVVGYEPAPPAVRSGG